MCLVQVLLLADSIVVKQLLLDKETNTVGSVCIKHMNNFSEFVKAFCDFGQEMVELTVMTRWHLNQVVTCSKPSLILLDLKTCELHSEESLQFTKY